MLRVISDYKGAQGTISLQKNEDVTELIPDDGGWTVVKKKDGTVGCAPSAHLGNTIFNCIVYQSLFRGAEKIPCCLLLQRRPRNDQSDKG